ncbi:MAG: TetR/AcrR family transcriptional regulator [Anaerovoracaceae bacterium]
MYHISKDKRAVQSSELIYKGLLECIKKKPFDQITVSDLQKASGVARTTFYRAFDNISDVLYWKCDTCFYDVLGNCSPRLFRDELDLARHYFQYWANHSDILELLIKINRQDIIYSCHMKNADILQQRFGNLPGIHMNHGDYFIAIRTGFTISILTVWLKNGRKEGADELVKIIEDQLSILTKCITKS